MKSTYPFIIGSGISGMFVSEALSASKIKHYLIGPPPEKIPKLGESMNPESSMDLLDKFQDLSSCFYAKEKVVTFFGDHKFTCDLKPKSGFASRMLYKVLGYNPPAYFLHVDRMEFDLKLYAKVCSSAYCNVIEDKVTFIKSNHSKDSVRRIEFGTNVVENPCFVFDCTNNSRILGRMISIEYRPLSKRQKVFFWHHINPIDSSKKSPFWSCSTTQIRLEKKVDQVEGFTWCFPIGNYISVGVSLDDTCDLNSNQIKDIVLSAYKERDIDIEDQYQKHTEIMQITNQYFVHNKGYGANWIMIGPSFGQAWFMAASGVASSLVGACIAPKIIQEPLKYGMMYQAYMQHVLTGHSSQQFLRYGDPNRLSRKEVTEWSGELILSHIRRLAYYAKYRNDAWGALGAYLVDSLIRFVPKKYLKCSVN